MVLTFNTNATNVDKVGVKPFATSHDISTASNKDLARKLSLPSTLQTLDNSVLLSRINDFRSSNAIAQPNTNAVDTDRDFRNAQKLNKNFQKNLNKNANLTNKFYFGEDISILEPLITPLNLEICGVHNESRNETDESKDKELATRRKSTESSNIKLSTTSAQVVGIWDWFSLKSSTIEDIETKIFLNLNSQIRREFVYIRNNSMKIWTVMKNETSTAIPIVLVHGYCGGVALWAHNFESLSSSHPLYAFDLIGFGRSSRPSFSQDPIVAEMQFVESIEDWRKQMNIEQMILLGHSLGGFLISSYAIKYPMRTKALILCDPWGFQDNENQNDPVDTPTPMWVKLITNVSRYVSPLSVFRAAGSISVTFFKYLRPDFKQKYITVMGNNDLIYDYLYHLNRLKPSGEEGFKAISEQYGFAKNPMIKRVEKIDADIPIWFIYGSRSWIDSTPGFSVKYIRNRFAFVSVKIIPGAGHHCYADKPKLFNDYVKEIIELIDVHDETCQNYTEQGSSSDPLDLSS